MQSHTGQTNTTSGRIDDVLLPLGLCSVASHRSIVQPMFCRLPHHLFSRTLQDSTTVHQGSDAGVRAVDLQSLNQGIISGSYNLPLNQGAPAPSAIPPRAAGVGVWARVPKGPAQTEPQQAAPSSFISPGAQRTAKSKMEGPGGTAGGGQKWGS